MFNKLQKLTNNKKVRKVFALCACIMVLGSMFVTSAFAVDGEAAADMTAQEAAETIFETVSGQINVGTIVAVIGIALTAGLALYFAWMKLSPTAAVLRKSSIV